MRGITSLSPEYRKATEFAVAQQFIAFVVTSLLLDGGMMLRVTLYAIASHWAVILVVIIRRPTSPTLFDLLLLGFGFIPVGVLAYIIAGLTGRGV